MQYHYISDKELYHFGRSKKDGAPIGSGRYPLGSGAAPSISKQQQRYNRVKYGRGGERRINKSVLSGTPFQADRRKELEELARKDIRFFRNMAIAGAAAGVTVYSARKLMRSKNIDGTRPSSPFNDRYVNIGADAVREIFRGDLLHA